MKKIILTSMVLVSTLMTGCANMNMQPGQTQNQQAQSQSVPVERAYKGKVQDKKTDFPMYGIHQGEKPLVVFQGIVLDVQPYKDESKTFKGINGFLSKLDPTLKLNDPSAKQMMDITIGTANKQQFHFKQAMQPGFVRGKVVLVVQFNNGDTILDPDVNKAEMIK